VALTVSNADVVEIDDGTEPRVDAVCSVRQPDGLSGVAEIEAKVTKPVIHSLPYDVSIVPLNLAHHRKDGKVSHEGRSFVGRQGHNREAIESHFLPLQEYSLTGKCGSGVVEKILLSIGLSAATEVVS
jgi:hypothetical protein